MRLDTVATVSTRPAFVKGSTPVKIQNTIAAGLVYTFDLKDLK